MRMMEFDIYLEKDILTHIKIVEHLYFYHKAILTDLMDHLNCSKSTLNHYIKDILELLAPYIKYSEYNSQYIEVILQPNVSLTDLTRPIYSRSKWLRILFRMVNGDTQPLSLCDKEFISRSKAYQLIKSVNIFMTEYEITTHELRFRTLYSFLFLHLDIANDYLIDDLFAQANYILDDLLHHNKDVYLEGSERQYILIYFYLSLWRMPEHPVQIEAYEFDYLEHECIYERITSYYQGINIHAYKQEAMISSIIYDQNISYNNYFLAQTHQERYWNNLIQKHSAVYYLYIQCMTLNKLVFIDEISMQKHFQKVLFYAWIGFFPYPTHYHIDKNSYEYQNFCNIFLRWNREFHYHLPFKEEYFEYLYYFIQKTAIPKQHTYVLSIVASTQDQFTVFYNYFNTYWNNHAFTVNPTIFHSLEELSDDMFQLPHIIICDKVLQNNRYQQHNIFYFDLNTLKQDSVILLDALLNNSHLS